MICHSSLPTFAGKTNQREQSTLPIQPSQSGASETISKRAPFGTLKPDQDTLHIRKTKAEREKETEYRIIKHNLETLPEAKQILHGPSSSEARKYFMEQISKTCPDNIQRFDTLVGLILPRLKVQGRVYRNCQPLFPDRTNLIWNCIKAGMMS